jgi:hypothetical protein
MSVIIKDPRQALVFLLAGNAYATFVSEKTGTRFTYRVAVPKNKNPNLGAPPHFVSVLTGPDQYSYLGCIYKRHLYAHGVKSRINSSAPSAQAFAWIWKHLSAGQMPPQCTIFHEGRCGRCGRQLTDPRSCLLALGPECARRGS